MPSKGMSKDITCYLRESDHKEYTQDNSNVHIGNVDASGGEVRAYQHSGFALPELLEEGPPLRRGHFLVVRD